MFRNNHRDPYEVLEISKNADTQTIRDAYKRLALKYHPDRNPSENVEENTRKFQDISEAYENLSNMSRQKSKIDINDIFKNFFGELYTGSRKDPNSHLHIYQEIELSLEDVYKGKTEHITYERRVPKMESCEDCSGTGRLSIPYKDENFQLQQNIQICSNCQGRGRLNERILESCSLDIPIQPGFSQTALYFQNKGHVDINGNSGDLFINVLYRSHEIFEQKGDNLYMDLDIDFKESLLGFEMDIEFLDGTTREIPINRPVKSGTLLKVNGMGINKKGNLFIKIKVTDFPKELTDEQRTAIESVF